MRRDPGTTDSWSSPITYAHEFGHYGFDLNDEYADGRSEVFCATNLRGSGDFGSRGARASCMMFSQFVAGKLCSGHTENRHRNGTSQGDENCWLHPVTVKFTGYITTNGPGTVKYTFTRNDGARAPVFTLDFDAAGTKPVNTSWMLGGPGLMK